ncbi:hypothetical protein ACQ86D_41840 [Streptomyces galilaeus]
MLSPQSPLLANARHEDGVLHDTDRLAVHDEVRSLLTGWDDGELCRRLDRDYARVSYFGFSALGAAPPPTRQTRRLRADPSPCGSRIPCCGCWPSSAC